MFLGISVHHMLTRKGSDYKEYQRRLQQEIEPLLSLIANKRSSLDSSVDYPKIIWLNQFPIVDFWGEIISTNTDIFTEKVHRYNLILRQVFRYYFV